MRSRLPRAFIVTIVCLLGLTPSSNGQFTPVAGDAPFRCGTSAATTERLIEVAHTASQRQPRHIRASSLPTITNRGGIAVLAADDRLAPFLHQFDLEGFSLLFTPIDKTSYSVTRSAAVAESDLGVLQQLPADTHSISYHLPFALPLFESTVQDVYISGYNAIQVTPPSVPGFWQWDALEVISQPGPLIAPLLTTPAAVRYEPSIYVKSASDSCTVTWQSFDYDVRATLSRDGRIRYSYVRASADGAAQSATVVLTSGGEKWRAGRSVFASTGEVPGGVYREAPADLVPVLDVASATIGRVDDTDLLRCELKIAAEPTSSNLAGGAVAFYALDFRDGTRHYTATATIQPGSPAALHAPRPLNGMGGDVVSAAVRQSGSNVTIDLLDELIGFVPTEVEITSFVDRSDTQWFGDQIRLPLPKATAAWSIATDFRQISDFRAKTILESFVRPTVDLVGVWETVRSALGWTDSSVDAVAVYENFPSDVDFTAVAYAFPGNFGGTGFGLPPIPDQPRYPTLIQMSKVFFSPGAMPSHQTTLLHEFAHTWLFFVAAAEDPIWQAMNPDGAHPSKALDTRAAFTVASAQDCSAMGGAVFTSHGDGSYDVDSRSPYGYSWLELYLMGLAAPSEVPPIVLLTDTSPPLTGPYWPSISVRLVRGKPVEKRVDDLAAALGPRLPAYPLGQSTFNVLFVLLADGSRPVEANDVNGVVWSRDAFVRDFATATGRRGSVSPTNPRNHGEGRRRAVTH